MPYQPTNEPALVRVRVSPNERISTKGSTFALRVEADYSDGSIPEVTGPAHFASGEKGIASVDEETL